MEQGTEAPPVGTDSRKSRSGNAVYFSNFSKITGWSFFFFFFFFQTFRQVESGALEPPERRMYMYSGHDTTLSSFLNALGLFDPPIPPPYASLIAVELRRRRQDGGFFVEISYRNDSSRSPYLLSLPECAASCPLSRFDELTRPLRPEDWRAECGLEADATARLVTVASAAVGAALFLVLACSVLLHCARRGDSRGAGAQGYASLSQDMA